MNAFIHMIEKWLIRLILIQLFFMFMAQFLLQFDGLVPFLNRAVRSEGVVQYLQPAAESVFAFF
ncbi:MAG TPA: DUF5359 family protein [Bacillales bacterium]|nr:DUF5359 family protein [Bacillales bacterium]